MSTEDIGEDQKPLDGEGGPTITFEQQRLSDELIKEKKLTFEEAAKYLNTLGKDETGSRYAYLMLTVTARKLTDITIIAQFKHLQFVDLSGNYLTVDKLDILVELPWLVWLKVERNRLESANLKAMHYLQVVDFSRNHIIDTFNIHQPLLDTLVLNYNAIHATQFDETSFNLEHLKQIELRGNALVELNGHYPLACQKLYLADNKITKLRPYENRGKFAQLEMLHLRDNRVRKLNGFTGDNIMHNLKYLNLRNNRIAKFRQFRKLKCLPNLDTLIITGNPVCRNQLLQENRGEGGEGDDGSAAIDPDRVRVLVLLPHLKRINKLLVSMREQHAARDGERELLDEIMNEISSDEEDDDEMAATTTDDASSLSPEEDTEYDQNEEEEEEEDDEEDD